MIAVTTVSSALAAFDYELRIPAMLALASLLEFPISYQQPDPKLPLHNATVASLTWLLIWLGGLSVMKQRVPSNKELLVDTTETALLIQHEAIVHGALSSLAKDDGDAHADGGGGRGSEVTPEHQSSGKRSAAK